MDDKQARVEDETNSVNNAGNPDTTEEARPGSTTPNGEGHEGHGQDHHQDSAHPENNNDQTADHEEPNVEPPPPTGTVEIGVKDASDNTIYFRIKRTMTFGRLFKTYADKESKDMKTLRFLFDGQRVLESSTANDLEMVDGDIIEVVTEQLGGFECLEDFTVKG